MLITLKNILKMAESKDMAIAAFNVTSLEGVLAVIEAAEDEDTPVILQFANAAHSKYISLEDIGRVMVAFADKSKVPVCVHLDHGNNFDEIKRALDLGFTSIMYDGSELSLKQNIANTKYAKILADEYGASIEAELGSMGTEGENENILGAYTDPEVARVFVNETGIYKSRPNLDFDIISGIRKLSGIPVVMHGGSGISDSDFKKCIDCGVRKINYYTYAAKYAGDAIRDMVKDKTGNIYSHDILVEIRRNMVKTYKETIRVFKNIQK